MSETPITLLASLIEISRLDALLAGIAAERRKLEKQLADRSAALQAAEGVAATKARVAAEREAHYQREERSLKDERQKLVDRRKAVATLSSYKLQQAAQREIDHATEGLDTHEEQVIKFLSEVESSKSAALTAQAGVANEREEVEALRRETAATLATLATREGDYKQARAGIAAQVDPAALTQYSRIASRYPANAVVKVNGSTCSGCFMQVGPQVLVQIARGQSLVRCPGCGRILCEDSAPAQQAEAGK